MNITIIFFVVGIFIFLGAAVRWAIKDNDKPCGWSEKADKDEK